MNKIEEIFKAWNISFNPNDEQAELASKRIKICNSCEFKIKNIGVNRCSICGCTLRGKVFSPVKGACPQGKWDVVDEKFELTKYEKPIERITTYDEHTSIIVSENLLSNKYHKRYLDFANDEKTNWGTKNDKNYWDGRALLHENFDHLKSDSPFEHLNYLNNFVLEIIKNKLKINFKIKQEIYPEYLALIKWEIGDNQPPRPEADPKIYHWRDFSCIYHLNDDYDGGEIYFPKQDIIMKPAANTLIFFPGHSEYEYGITPVTKGIRHTLTSFWTFDNQYHINNTIKLKIN